MLANILGKHDAAYYDMGCDIELTMAEELASGSRRHLSRMRGDMSRHFTSLESISSNAAIEYATAERPKRDDLAIFVANENAGAAHE